MTQTDDKIENQIQLSEDQVQAIAAVLDWWQNSTKQTFTLAGFAGTGKTSIMSRIIDEVARLGTPIMVGAPTGKAALRLRQKGVEASTIHMLAYQYRGKDKETGELKFDYKGIDGDDPLVVIDEASMVNDKIYQDLISSGYRMLFVGDHGQLPPVGGDPGLMRDPDFVLTTIHRQKGNADLLDFAHALREGERSPVAKGTVRAIRRIDGLAPVSDVVRLSDVILCHQNKTRHWLNVRAMWLREQLPKDFALPKEVNVVVARRQTLDALVGKTFPVVCLRNNYLYKIYNGQVFSFKMTKHHQAKDSFEDACTGILTSEEGDTVPMDFQANGFFADKETEFIEGSAIFDFGSALTVHKSQGSEWDHVAVWDDTFPGMNDRPRWMYTAATRAKRTLAWIR